MAMGGAHRIAVAERVVVSRITYRAPLFSVL
jgi:hypothetical protein